MDVRQLADGLWRWTAGELGCVYYEALDAVVLIDPLVPAHEAERFLAYLDRDVERLRLPVSILLTDPRDERSAAFLRDRYDADDRLPASVEAFEFAYFIRPHRALVVRTLAPLAAAIADLPIELVLVSNPAPARVPAARGSSAR